MRSRLGSPSPRKYFATRSVARGAAGSRKGAELRRLLKEEFISELHDVSNRADITITSFLRANGVIAMSQRCLSVIGFADARGSSELTFRRHGADLRRTLREDA